MNPDSLRHLLDPALLQTLLLIGGGLAGVTLLWTVLSRPSPYPYAATDPLLSAAEKIFYEALHEAIGDQFAVFSKVRLADIIQVRPGVTGKRRQAAFNRIKSKHADFVACDPLTYEVVCVVELDDRSHLQRSRIKRDIFVDGALGAARVPILHVVCRKHYSVELLRAQIDAVLHGERIPES